MLQQLKITYPRKILKLNIKYFLRRGVNAIGLIFYSLLFGTVMSLLEDKAKPLRDVVHAVDEVNIKTVSGLIA